MAELIKPEQNRVLILDGMWNKTLAAVRSLGRRGIHVSAGEWTRFATALFSKYCGRRIIYPSPLFTPGKFIEWLIAELKANNYDMVLPAELSTQMLLVKNRTEIEKYTALPFADYELTANVQDKKWLMKHAIANGYPCPRTIFIDKLDKVESIRDKIRYPAVIKPAVSSGSRGIVYVHEPSGLAGAYLKVHKKYPYPLIQEFIPNGGAYGVGVLMNFDSEPRASFVYKRLREYPVTGGPSTLRESVENEEIRVAAVSLLKSLDWKGIAMVEFKVDERDGIPKLMEINPRLWGSLQLPIMAGVDFPWLLYKLAVEGDTEPVSRYRTGVKCRCLIPGEVLHFVTNPDRFSMKPGLFTGGAGDDILSSDDIMPLLGRISSFLPLIYKREMRKILF